VDASVAGGTVVVVDASVAGGAVVAAALTTSTAEHGLDSATQCVLATIRGLRFDAADDSQILTVDLPIVFAR